jgi:ADP-L-glycero-D-manno-heptose 6-epimerase
VSRRVILVTGGAGFIGSNVVGLLASSKDVDIVVCDRLRTADLGKWRNLLNHQIADIVDPDQILAWLDAHISDLDCIVHMGAISSTTEQDVDLILRSNYRLSRELLDWCVLHRKRLIYASSAATYGDGKLGFDDDAQAESLAALRPLNAYGWSKSLFDQHAFRLWSDGEKPTQLVGLKFFNVYGPNEGHKGSMKSVVAQIWPKVAAGETVDLFRSHHPDYADGGQLRDFVYVRDVAKIIVWLVEHPDVNGLFNIGSGQARSFLDLATQVFVASRKTPQIRYVDTPISIRANYQYFTEARIQRLRDAGYEDPLTSLEDGVRDYVQSYLATSSPYL